MTTEHKIQLITNFIAQKKRADEQMEALQKLTGAVYTSPLFDAVYRCIEAALDGLSIAVEGQRDGWVNWFIYENDCGQKALAAGVKGRVPLRPTKTVRRLVKLIEATPGGEFHRP